MSHRETHQQKALALIRDLNAIEKGTLPSAGYKYDDTIDFRQVSPHTAQRVYALLIAGTEGFAPATPEHEKIARDAGYWVAKRVNKAKDLRDSLSMYMPAIQRFLRAAEREVLEFTSSKTYLLKALDEIREALDGTEEMVREHEDRDPTEADSGEEDDPNATRVEDFGNSLEDFGNSLKAH
ncbi:hypothetical protein B0H13DRAFT_1903251 [Mycena leptocephala]|nr:hypothetical protein B0H13DRAFT_1903251 [Mycena leptocephala]